MMHDDRLFDFGKGCIEAWFVFLHIRDNRCHRTLISKKIFTVFTICRYTALCWIADLNKQFWFLDLMKVWEIPSPMKTIDMKACSTWNDLSSKGNLNDNRKSWQKMQNSVFNLYNKRHKATHNEPSKSWCQCLSATHVYMFCASVVDLLERDLVYKNKSDKIKSAATSIWQVTYHSQLRYLKQCCMVSWHMATLPSFHSPISFQNMPKGLLLSVLPRTFRSYLPTT